MLSLTLAALVSFAVAASGSKLIEIEIARAAIRARLLPDVVHVPAFLEVR